MAAEFRHDGIVLRRLEIICKKVEENRASGFKSLATKWNEAGIDAEMVMAPWATSTVR